MSIKVFVIGRPGSGKTTVVRHILEIAQNMNISTVSKRDYDILYNMFIKDCENSGMQKKFRPTEYGGFAVLDHTMFDTALEDLEKQVIEEVGKAPIGRKLITVEFARDDYRSTFCKFSREFLQDAYFFFIEADLPICIERIHRRRSNPLQSDSHDVPDDIMYTYYHINNLEYMTNEFQAEYPIIKGVEPYLNNTSEAELYAVVDNFIDGIFNKEFPTSTTSYSDHSHI